MLVHFIMFFSSPEWTHQHNVKPSNDSLSYVKQIYRTSSCKSVPEDHSNPTDLYSTTTNRDSGTSSPLSHERTTMSTRANATVKKQQQQQQQAISSHATTKKKTKISLSVSCSRNSCEHEDESDSNDSVFSTGSSTDSNLCDTGGSPGIEIRDIYLGGSCMLRTNWRKDYAIPMLIQRGVTYHLPILHESICSMIPECNESAETILTSPPPPPPPVVASEPSHPVEPEVQLRKKIQPKLKLLTTAPEQNDEELASATSGRATIDSGTPPLKRTMFSPNILDASRVLLFTITNETRSLAPMTLAAHYIGLGYNVVLCVQMLPEFCIIGHDKVCVASTVLNQIYIIFSEHTVNSGCYQGL